MAGRIRVCFVITALAGGGAEKQCVKLLNELQTRDDIDLTLVRLGPGVLDDTLHHDRIDVRDLHVSSYYHPLTPLRVAKIVRETKADLVFSWMQAADINAWLASLTRRKTRWVVAERNSRHPDDWRFKLRIATARRAAGIISNSLAGDAYWRANGAKGRRFVVGNVASLSPAAAAKGGGVLFVGRLEPAKNVSVLVDTFLEVRRKRPDTTFHLVGDGSLRPSLEAQIKAAGAAEAITLHGFQRSPETFFGSADLFVTLSRREGLPNVLMEAVASDCRIVASAIAPHEEFLGPDFPHYVSDLDSPTEAAVAIVSALDAPLDPSTLTFARERLDGMTPAAVAESYVTAFRVLAGQRSHSP